MKEKRLIKILLLIMSVASLSACAELQSVVVANKKATADNRERVYGKTDDASRSLWNR